MTRDEFMDTLERDGWIGVDLDGTLAEWNDQTGPSYIGPPVPAMVQRVRSWIDTGRQVKIVTARIGGAEPDLQRRQIQTWLEEHVGYLYASRIEITNQKNLGMLALWDDLAVTVERNSGRPLVPGFEEENMDISSKVPIVCVDGSTFSVDLRGIYMILISTDGARIEQKQLSQGDCLLSLFWKHAIRADAKPTKCPVSMDEALRFQLAWEAYEEK